MCIRDSTALDAVGASSPQLTSLNAHGLRVEGAAVLQRLLQRCTGLKSIDFNDVVLAREAAEPADADARRRIEREEAALATVLDVIRTRRPYVWDDCQVHCFTSGMRFLNGTTEG